MHLPAGYTELLNAKRDRLAIEAVWTYLAEEDGSHRVLPDGRCDIILRFMVEGSSPAGNIQALIAGPSTTYHNVTLVSGLGFVGVRLRPGTAKAILNLELSSITDHVLSYEETIEAVPEICALCAPAVSIEQLIDRLVGFVTCRRSRNIHQVSTLRAMMMIEALHVGGGRLSVVDLAQMHDVDERTVRRDIKAATGLGPKDFAMILQFHRAIRLLRDAGLDPISAAAEAGYADQAHMTRVFRQLGGFTPGNLPDITLADIPL